MVSFLADENLECFIVNQLRERPLKVNIVRAQDVGLAATDDRIILDWAARNERIVVTRDVSTMRTYANERIRSGQAMPGIVAVPNSATVAQVIDVLENMVRFGLEGEWANQVWFIGSDPLSFNR